MAEAKDMHEQQNEKIGLLTDQILRLEKSNDELEAQVEIGTAELNEYKRELKESNIALKVLLKERDTVIRDVESRLIENIRQRVAPYLEKLKKTSVNDSQRLDLLEIEANLNNICDPFIKKLTKEYHGITAEESKVVRYVKEGKTTHEISDLLKISTGEVDTYRNHLRRKLGINNSDINLESYLRTIDILKVESRM